MVSYRYIDYVSVLAFIERWQPETNSFRMPFGEMTITLNDVYHLLQIPVAGKSVYGNVPKKAEENTVQIQWLIKYLGCTEEEAKEACKSVYAVRFDWLMNLCKGRVKKLGKSASKRKIEHAARGYLLFMVGCLLFLDKSGNRVSVYYLLSVRKVGKCKDYAWGMGELAHLYRKLGIASRVDVRQMACIYMTTSIWQGVLEISISSIASHVYANGGCKRCQGCICTVTGAKGTLDDLKASDVVWNPYSEKSEAYPFQEVSWYNGLLICYDVGEPYYPERVLRQAGRVQAIPRPPMLPLSEEPDTN